MPTAHVQCAALLKIPPPEGGGRPSGRPRRQEPGLEGRFKPPTTAFPPPLHQSPSGNANYPAVMTKREEGNAGFFFYFNRRFSQRCHPTPRVRFLRKAGDLP